ncbi:TIGR04283 family arsenosugar biosynthesis glycosyltransferase [Companilactobacillus keshanensis]|uniref:TIGR04283 family arsenosugar biosynthesis glycosyltransferase n=1 Tax=Companilactobacillus keshanensis TaxID=2486003 RepID=A0ABW4BV99_9LACO|nr:TIGR04283 family arsenosugar biosynthesis glycosyltransferase [Companilactobacillus keshanensis]
MWLTIIIPTFHDDDSLKEILSEIQSWRPVGVEIIITDGEKRARPNWLPDNVIYLSSKANRGFQLRLGAKNAQADKLLFLHADSHFIKGSPLSLLKKTTAQIGFFRIHFDDSALFFKVLAFSSNIRAKYLKLIFGDQGLFVTKKVYQKAGGFPVLPLMEDYEFSRSLSKLHIEFAQLNLPIMTSARKYQNEGYFKTFFRMQKIRFFYRMGVNPEILKRMYYRRG